MYAETVAGRPSRAGCGRHFAEGFEAVEASWIFLILGLRNVPTPPLYGMTSEKSKRGPPNKRLKLAAPSCCSSLLFVKSSQSVPQLRRTPLGGSPRKLDSPSPEL